MEMACQPARRREALLAAAHIRERDAATAWLVSTAGTLLPHGAPQCWGAKVYFRKRL